MDQLNSMFSRMKRGLWTGGDSSQPSVKQQHMENDSSAIPDLPEEDGFLLIGEPSRDAVTQRVLPLGQAPSLGNSEDVCRPDQAFTMFATCNPVPLTPEASAEMQNEAHSIALHPALFGVPFQLHPRLEAGTLSQYMLGHLDLEVKRMDWQKYDYDFDSDRSSLRELCAVSESSSPTGCSHLTPSLQSWHR
ncbi:uncharacterized protein [Littorina saxatilis]|uniref:Uncharacterized protein n=1 Tax=Littorina saxatilis TaxID=31220 RepID=A0AAN9BQN9_9CAEN